MGEVLTRSGVTRYGFEFTTLRKETVSHANNNQCRNELTGQVPGLAEVEDLSFPAPEELLPVMVREPRVGPQQSGECNGQLKGNRSVAGARDLWARKVEIRTPVGRICVCGFIPRKKFIKSAGDAWGGKRGT